MHRQVLNEFDTIEQGKCIVQELIHDPTKYAGHMVQYLDDYLFKKHLLSTLRPSSQKEVLHRGLAAEFSSIQEILEKSKDIKDPSQYNIRSRIVQEDPVIHHSGYKAAPRTSKLMFTLGQKLSGSVNKSSKAVPVSRPPLQVKASSFCPYVPSIMGTDAPPKEGILRCYECGQKGHNKPQCPMLIFANASAYIQVTSMTEWVLRCREWTVAAYMREHIAITNVNMFTFHLTCS